MKARGREEPGDRAVKAPEVVGAEGVRGFVGRGAEQ